MTKKDKHHSSDQLEVVEGALTRTERFIETYQKQITTVVLVILSVIAISILVKRQYLDPLELDAQEQMFVAEQHFESDSFNIALYGDGMSFGFIDIIDEYGLTKSGNLAKYYAGVSFLHLGDYEEALNYLKKYNPKDKLVAVNAFGNIGDAYIELGETEKGIKYYLKAANYNKNSYSSPIYLMKAGYGYESIGEYDKANEVYTIIKEEYSESTAGRNIEKYISRTR